MVCPCYLPSSISLCACRKIWFLGIKLLLTGPGLCTHTPTHTTVGCAPLTDIQFTSRFLPLSSSPRPALLSFCRHTKPCSCLLLSAQTRITRTADSYSRTEFSTFLYQGPTYGPFSFMVYIQTKTERSKSANIAVVRIVVNGGCFVVSVVVFVVMLLNCAIC